MHFRDTRLPGLPGDGREQGGDAVELMCGIVQGNAVGDEPPAQTILRLMHDLLTSGSVAVIKGSIARERADGPLETIPQVSQIGEKVGEIRLVFNNVRTVFSSVEALQKRGDALDLELLRDAHRALFTRNGAGGLRPGEFRTEQNWIGPKGCSLDSASFVPPNPQDMMNGLRALEDYMHRESDLDPLLRASLIHYQFETLHPFADGNGRIGRLLILLNLLDQGVIDAPYLCPSYQLNLFRSHYYDALQHIREEGDYETWLKFFLRVIEAAAEEALTTMVKLDRVREASVAAVLENCSGAVRRAKRTAFLEYLEKRPIIEIGRTAKDLGWTFPTALLEQCVDFRRGRPQTARESGSPSRGSTSSSALRSS